LDSAVAAAVQDPLTKSVLQLLRRFTRSEMPSESGKAGGIEAGGIEPKALRRSLDRLEKAGLIGRRRAEGARREPSFCALGDAFIVTFDSAEKTQAARVDGIGGVSAEHVRPGMREAGNKRPVRVPGFHCRCNDLMTLTAEDVGELKEILHLLHWFTAELCSHQRVGEDLEPQECNRRLTLGLGRP